MPWNFSSLASEALTDQVTPSARLCKMVPRSWSLSCLSVSSGLRRSSGCDRSALRSIVWVMSVNVPLVAAVPLQGADIVFRRLRGAVAGGGDGLEQRLVHARRHACCVAADIKMR